MSTGARPDREVRRALIPCGGRGTRMSQLAGGLPKELIRVGGRPVVRIVAEECARSGISELMIVVAPGKEAIVEYLDTHAGEHWLPRRIEFATQPQPRGLADAIRLGREFAGQEALAVALPDNLFPDAPAVAQVMESYSRTGKNVVGMVEISSHESLRRGATPVYSGTLDADDFRIERIPEKGASHARFDTGGADSAFTGIGRLVFTPECFAVIDEVERTLRPGAELDDIAVMQRLLERDRLIGRRIHGRFLDVGVPDGYQEADEVYSTTA